MAKWKHYITRPMSLFESSLWYKCYSTPYSSKILGTVMTDAIFVEYPKGSSAHFRNSTQFKKFVLSIQKLTKNQPQKMKKILTQGLKMVEDAKKCVVNPTGVKNLDWAVNLLTQVGLYTVVIPFMALNSVAKRDWSADNLKLVEKIRGQTIYPQFMKKVIARLGAQILKKAGIKNASRAIHLITINELSKEQFGVLAQRMSDRESGKLFAYEISNGVEKVKFSHNNKKLFTELTGFSFADEDIIKGRIAFRGKVTGRARIVIDGIVKNFLDGDVLVSINSSPALMPYIRRCGAIVTDEGGQACHASIVARELKKPCIIGTKIATQIFKDGDRVEVDANSGVVRKIS